MSDEKQFYYDKYKILDVTDLDEKYKSVKLEANEHGEFVYIILPEWEYLSVVTDEPSDATTVRNKRAIVITDKLYDILKDMDVRMEDISFVMNKLVTKLQGVEEDENNKRLGVDSRYDIRLKTHIDKL